MLENIEEMKLIDISDMHKLEEEKLVKLNSVKLKEFDSWVH